MNIIAVMIAVAADSFIDKNIISFDASLVM
jgi:hypothetical protein